MQPAQTRQETEGFPPLLKRARISPLRASTLKALLHAHFAGNVPHRACAPVPDPTGHLSRSGSVRRQEREA